MITCKSKSLVTTCLRVVRQVGFRSLSNQAEPSNIRPLYLDAQATTPMDPRVLDAMMPYMTGKLNKFQKNKDLKLQWDYFKILRSKNTSALVYLTGSIVLEDLKYIFLSLPRQPSWTLVLLS